MVLRWGLPGFRRVSMVLTGYFLVALMVYYHSWCFHGASVVLSGSVR